jgi:hypothetical protein
MNDKMALNLIAEIMGWDENTDGVATREYAWLRLMSAIKYDGYADFRAGVRFIESLATWLKQFRREDRAAAYKFVKSRLVYIAPAELHKLIESFVPEVVTPHLRNAVAQDLGIKPYEVWANPDGAKAFERRLRKTLIVGMSDGSRVDILRRVNSRRLSTEQVVPMMNIDDEKWRDLDEKLAQDLAGESGDAKFDSVYLLDDFTASGTTFVRKIDGKWKGKLKKFNDLVTVARQKLQKSFPLAEGYALHIHHYISSDQARATLDERLKEAAASWDGKSYGSVTVTEGLRLPPSMKLSPPADAAMLDLCDRYYDHGLFLRLEKHCREAGQTDMKRGYADCALPIVLDHNTPNNSISLLWAETSGDNGAHPMEPLFRRRDRHG